LNLGEIKKKRFKEKDGTNNYMNVSIEEMDWLLEQVERWEKAYWYFKEPLEQLSYVDHHKCTRSIELEQLEDLTMLMDALWYEKTEGKSGIYDERVGFVSHEEIEKAVESVYEKNLKVGDIVKHKDAAYSEDFKIVAIYSEEDGCDFMIQGPEPKYLLPFPVSKEKLYQV
jgi:hypothetical protein